MINYKNFIGYTKGPWQWFGNTDIKRYYLATIDRGRQYVLFFLGGVTNNVIPAFQKNNVLEKAENMVVYEVAPVIGIKNITKAVYRRDFIGIEHPDAYLIASSPELLEENLFLIDMLKKSITNSFIELCDMQKIIQIFEREGKENMKYKL